MKQFLLFIYTFLFCLGIHAQGVYELVTNVSQIKNEDICIIVSQDYAKAMGYAKTNNRGEANIQFFNNKNNIIASPATKTTDQTNLYEFLIEKTSTNYKFKDIINGKYLSVDNNTNNNNLYTKNTETTTFKISIENNIATITSTIKKGTVSPIVKYNSTSNLFSVYTNSGQSPVSIYRKINSIIFDEKNEYLPSEEINETRRVILNRPLNAEQWYTFCSPYDIVNPTSVFGNGAVAEELISISNDSEGTYLNFQISNSIQAGKPYLIYLTQPLDFIDLGNISLTTIDWSNLCESAKVETTGYYFVGNLKRQKVEQGTYFIKNSEFYLTDSENVMISAFRASITPNRTSSAKLRINAQDPATGIYTIPIKNIDNTKLKTSNEIYTLTGIRKNNLDNLKPGLYIINGKKFLIK